MLEQKVHNSNERIAAQEALMVQLTNVSQQHHHDQSLSVNELQWTNNAKFLHDMVQQVNQLRTLLVSWVWVRAY